MRSSVSYVERWHDAEGCCKHQVTTPDEGACCVCDMDDPCNWVQQQAMVFCREGDELAAGDTRWEQASDR